MTNRDDLIQCLQREIFETRSLRRWESATAEERAFALGDAVVMADGVVDFVSAWMEQRQSTCVMPEALRAWEADMEDL